MPRTVSATTDTEIAKAVTKPFWLVYIGYGTPLRYSSGPEAVQTDYLQDELDNYYTDASGNKLQDEVVVTWTPNDMQVTINPDRNTGTLKIQNTDFSFGNTVLATSMADIPIKVYKLYGDGTHESADPELLFDGVGGKCTIDLRWVTVRLESASTKIMFCPRVMCTKEMGFNHLPPDKLTISWGGEQYTLET